MSAIRIPQALNDCGCCDGLTTSTPRRIGNREGLETVAYRVGDYHDFRDSMLAALSSSERPVLRALSTREQDDFSIALVDAWACVADVLSFYQEYFANEGLLRTAKERLSVIEHARLIGYRAKPGVAASAYLAFTMDEPAPGTPNPVLHTTLAAGSQVQSTPGPDETAQLYETLEDVQARVDWNALRPRLTQPQQVTAGMDSIMVAGIAPFVRKGDQLLIVTDTEKSVVQIGDVIVDEENQVSRLRISSDDVSPASFTTPSLPEGDFADLDGYETLDAAVADIVLARRWKQEDLIAIVESRHWRLEQLAELINNRSDKQSPTQDDSTGVYGFRKTASLFGYNAQKRVTYGSDGTPNDISTWPDWDRAGDESASSLYLDNSYDQLIPGSYVVLHYPSLWELTGPGGFGYYLLTQVAEGKTVYEVSTADTIARTAYGVSARTTQIGLSDDVPGWDYAPNMMLLIRQSSMLVESEALDLVQVPVTNPVEGDRILLHCADLFLTSGQYVAVTGESMDETGVYYSEIIQIKQVWLENGFSEIIFFTSLKHRYLRDTVVINANVAPASHGETVSEVLGDGDAALRNQFFELKQTPLTWISAEVPGGRQSSLEVRVNDVLWQEVDNFLGTGGDQRIYTTSVDDDGVTRIQFGDGVEGARLPSGVSNVVATYRKGVGLGGLVGADQLNVLLTRPLGVKDVINPEKSGGAEDPESLDDVRLNAPLGLLTLDRTVSLTDYEDFCRSFAGIAKARAVAVHRQGIPNINITIAGPQGALIESTSKTWQNLLTALQDAGDPYTRFSLLNFRPVFFRFDAGLFVLPEYDSELILKQAAEAMQSAFDFASRAFNQPVHLSEVISVLQGVEGVVAVDVNQLYRAGEVAQDPPPRSLMPRPATGDGAIAGAELLMLDTAPIDQLRIKT